MKRFALILLALLLPVVAFASDNENLADEWATVSMGGARIGYVHTITQKIAEPEPQVITSVFAETKLKRLGMPISIRTDVEYRETLNGALISAVSHTTGSGIDMHTNAVVKEDSLIITVRIGGVPEERVLPWDGSIKGPHAQSALIKEKGFAPGTVTSFNAFVPEFQRVAASSVKFIKDETLTVQGEEMLLHRGEMTQDVLPGIVTQVWLDDNGDMKRSVTDLLDGIETLASTREEALKAIVPAELADVAGQFSVISNIQIAEPRQLKEAVYLIKGEPSVLKALQIEDDRQKILEKTEEGITLQINALPEKFAAAGPGEELLKPTQFLQSADPQIKAAAEKAVEGAATAEEKAKRLEQWVFKTIDKKNYSLAFASAREVFLSQEGDCTEHAMLLAAMLRAVGVPSRVAVGIVYWKGAFYYHMWTEAWTGDHWLALDATLAEDFVDATHIKMAESALESATAFDPFISIIRVIGRISITVQSLNGKPVAP